MHLQPLLGLIKDLLAILYWFSCLHIYRELNTKEEKLSKDALNLDKEALVFQEVYEGIMVEERS
jgi:hypothetical protein